MEYELRFNSKRNKYCIKQYIFHVKIIKNDFEISSWYNLTAVNILFLLFMSFF